MIVVGVDPGPEESSWVAWAPEHHRIVDFVGEDKNESLIKRLTFEGFNCDVLAIEQVRGFGVMASDKLFDTCAWSGRFFERWGANRSAWVPRKIAAAHICGVGGISKDSFVREAILARFGGKDAAVGTKKAPGPLYGISGHLWPALAVAITWSEKYGRPNHD